MYSYICSNLVVRIKSTRCAKRLTKQSTKQFNTPSTNWKKIAYRLIQKLNIFFMKIGMVISIFTCVELSLFPGLRKFRNYIYCVFT